MDKNQFYHDPDDKIPKRVLGEVTYAYTVLGGKIQIEWRQITSDLERPNKDEGHAESI